MATKHVICNLNLNGNQIENAVAQVLATAPANPVAGQFYYDSAKSAIGYYTGSSWSYVDDGNVYAIDTLGDATASEQFAVYYGSTESTSGNDTLTTFNFRALKSDGTNIKLTQKISSGKEYIEISLNDLAISKITGLQTALDNKLDDSQLSTSGTLIDSGESAALDTKIPSQKAVKTYVDAEINKVNTDIAGAMHFIGTWDGTKSVAQNISASGLTKLRKGDYWLVDTPCAHANIPEGGIESSTGDQGLVTGDMIVTISDRSSTGAIVVGDFKVIDNTESADLVRLDSTQTLTNKTISGSNNTFSNIPESAVTNLTTDLDSKVAKTSITTGDALNSNTSTNKTTVPSDYTVGKVIESVTGGAVHQYKQVVTSGTSVSIAATTHDCGKYPEVKVYQLSGSTLNEVLASVSMNASGDVTISWNTAATASTAISIIIVGSTSIV